MESQTFCSFITKNTTVIWCWTPSSPPIYLKYIRDSKYSGSMWSLRYAQGHSCSALIRSILTFPDTTGYAFFLSYVNWVRQTVAVCKWMMEKNRQVNVISQTHWKQKLSTTFPLFPTPTLNKYSLEGKGYIPLSYKISYYKWSPVAKRQ